MESRFQFGTIDGIPHLLRTLQNGIHENVVTGEVYSARTPITDVKILPIFPRNIWDLILVQTRSEDGVIRFHLWGLQDAGSLGSFLEIYPNETDEHETIISVSNVRINKIETANPVPNIYTSYLQSKIGQDYGQSMDSWKERFTIYFDTVNHWIFYRSSNDKYFDIDGKR